MLCNWQLHKDYQNNLILKLLFYQKTQRSRLVSLDKSISKIYLLNLDNLLPIVKSLYPDFGRPAKNQQGIICSLILMLDLQEYSITKWASIVKSDKLLFDICGFETQNAPSVVSYYDLLSRLWLSSHSEHIMKKSRTRKFHPKPSKKLKANQKLPNKRSGIVKRLVNRLINAKLPKSRPEEILQEFLARCVVDYSGELGLLGNTSAISVAFDGSPYYSSASHYGVKVCDCKAKGIHNCKCPRKYSDPDATWGWDSYREL